MNFVEQYYEFKHRWYFKIGSLLFDFYLNKEPNVTVDKIKYDFLEELIESYINKVEIDEASIKSKLKSIDASKLNKLEFEILEYVLYVSSTYKDNVFSSIDYVYFTMILEITTQLYSSAFMGINEKFVYNILKENLFRFDFVDFKRKQTKINLMIKYLKYINKNENKLFINLQNRNVEINVTALSNHNNYFVIDVINKLPNLAKYNEELIENVEKNNDYLNKLFILNFNLIIEKIVYLLEKEKFTIDKIIFNIDKYKFSRNIINYINSYESLISDKIMLCSSDKKKLDYISNKYAKCIFVDDKLEKTTEFKEKNLLVKKSFWNSHKMNSQKYKEINFITISDNIAYKFKEEK